MKRITVEFPDGYDEAVAITAVGREIIRSENEHTQVVANLTTQSVELKGHNGDVLVIKPHERPEWRKLETGWVPVTERLPEDRQLVLVCTKKSKSTLQAMFWIYSIENHSDFVVASGGYLPVDAVTHWMPLPNKPEGV